MLIDYPNMKPITTLRVFPALFCRFHPCESCSVWHFLSLCVSFFSRAFICFTCSSWVFPPCCFLSLLFFLHSISFSSFGPRVTSAFCSSRRPTFAHRVSSVFLVLVPRAVTVCPEFNFYVSLLVFWKLPQTSFVGSLFDFGFVLGC